MSNPLPLDQAAAATGKSEVTLRRLIKAGKIPFQKDATLTGFIYRVDPEKVKAYYQHRGGGVFGEENSESTPAEEATEPDNTEPVEHEPQQSGSGRRLPSVRVAIAGESGDSMDYWLKKSEMYEDRYNQEVVRHAQTREELGVWRGRAEQAQSMLMKLLPAPEAVEAAATGVAQKSQAVAKAKSSDEVSWASLLLIIGLVILLVVAGGFILYLRFIPR